MLSSATGTVNDSDVPVSKIPDHIYSSVTTLRSEVTTILTSLRMVVVMVVVSCILPQTV